MISIVSKQFLPFLLMTAIGVNINITKGWRGIVPLKSTRAEVERILGRPDKESVNAYDFPEESVLFRYSQRRCDEQWNVAPDTVLYISINPKVKRPLTELNLDLTKYKKKPGDFDVLDHFYYVDEEQGLTLSVRSGMVQEYIYGPTAKDNPLRCRKLTGI
jgi:hypothetical protein